VICRRTLIGCLLAQVERYACTLYTYFFQMYAFYSHIFNYHMRFYVHQKRGVVPEPVLSRALTTARTWQVVVQSQCTPSTWPVSPLATSQVGPRVISGQ
jgi:hypothetical protein